MLYASTRSLKLLKRTRAISSRCGSSNAVCASSSRTLSDFLSNMCLLQFRKMVCLPFALSPRGGVCADKDSFARWTWPKHQQAEGDTLGHVADFSDLFVHAIAKTGHLTDNAISRSIDVASRGPRDSASTSHFEEHLHAHVQSPGARRATR